MEMGISLVDYRNRLRMDRFLSQVEEAPEDGTDTLLRAALDAGFGSYTQFYRVHKKLLGRAPAGRVLNGRESTIARETQVTSRETSVDRQRPATGGRTVSRERSVESLLGQSSELAAG
jgi:AraC-like DNA-binding protein